MNRIGYTRYVAQGGDVGQAVTDAMGRQAPEGLLGIHINVLAAALVSHGPTAGGVRAGTRGARRAQHVHDGRHRRRPGAVHPTADARLRAAGFTRRHGGLDARPRHRQLLQDLPRVRRRRARGQSHPGQHRRQHHAVLADGHRRLGPPVVLGDRTGPGSQRGRPGPSGGLGSGRPSRRSPASSGLPRAAGSRWSTPASPTSTRSTRAATSPPGRSRSCSPPSSATRSGPFADDRLSRVHMPSLAMQAVFLQLFGGDNDERRRTCP